MKQLFMKTVTALLEWEAKLVLRKYKPIVIAVTGSVGKTSAKDAMYAVLAPHFSVRKSQKSFNSEIGVPLTVLGLPNAWGNPFKWLENIVQGLIQVVVRHPYPKYLVLEIGADKPGDIKRAAEWVKPDISVITALGTVPVHVEFFASPEAVAEEKGQLVRALAPAGLLVVNGDDPKAPYFKSLTTAPSLSFGFSAHCDLRASHAAFQYEGEGKTRKPLGVTFRTTYKGTSMPIVLRGSLGVQLAYSALAAAAVGLHYGLNLVQIAEALSAYTPPPGRMRIVDGEKDSTILDDSYNSSPIALREALEALRMLETTGTKYAVLGDMMELGKYSRDEHYNAGALAEGIAGVLVAVGLRMRAAAEGALDAGMDESKVLQFDTAYEAAAYLEPLLKPGDALLIKGSQSMRMERVAYLLMKEPARAKEFLVRQEEEWQKKK